MNRGRAWRHAHRGNRFRSGLIPGSRTPPIPTRTDIAPRLRRLIGTPSFSSALEALGDSISGHELIHTSYFDHPEVVRERHHAAGTALESISVRW